ncbi:hypothetical protein FOQG_05831 [Fusarium oxysporum f. sp. raphani 54005]|uniref:Uncharacterized protein n=6 Tax=Fusarium oxysporum species complex TaxID=171631 RepID=X0CPP9_FUSOX|nr:hypothetical protein FOVG_05146 [Fusarium oxysporum f. sp. pisi HDV247]EXK92814.1 hypothetical protein FOQG_05831 [Fusarium oxysporum f. sp. raphani 54005]EXL78921.1 hypothetical protein FOPG_07122 [Fusarium oxysporum f. sp. conglutinans race 2 54008]EXM29735.1 hypothetical protein FOTG_04861 [Fusarium oxysporum f. sp. vasinfectum 25433]KAI8409480.1 hypothetical protein FOFC_09320 [Fusarium oxysporum]
MVIVRSRKGLGFLGSQIWRPSARLREMRGFLIGERQRLKRRCFLQLWSPPPHGKDSTITFWSQNRSLQLPTLVLQQMQWREDEGFPRDPAPLRSALVGTPAMLAGAIERLASTTR